jgi:25S rRNA (uracil2634-N3)-methyltransferase
MYIKPNWRILTIGDGDLSFSASVWQNFKPKQLTATVFDSQKTLEDKYQHHAIDLLKTDSNQQLLFGFDVTAPNTWPENWRNLKHQQFDLVIFQFPLVPAFEIHSIFTIRAISVLIPLTAYHYANTLFTALNISLILTARSYATSPQKT